MIGFSKADSYDSTSIEKKLKEIDEEITRAIKCMVSSAAEGHDGSEFVSDVNDLCNMYKDLSDLCAYEHIQDQNNLLKSTLAYLGGIYTNTKLEIKNAEKFAENTRRRLEEINIKIDNYDKMIRSLKNKLKRITWEDIKKKLKEVDNEIHDLSSPLNDDESSNERICDLYILHTQLAEIDMMYYNKDQATRMKETLESVLDRYEDDPEKYENRMDLVTRTREKFSIYCDIINSYENTIHSLCEKLDL